MKKDIIVEDVSDIRLDTYLASVFNEYSRSQINKKIKNGKVLVNDISVKPSYILEIGDKISIETLEIEKPEILPKNIDLDIIYEDEYIIIINKPKGMVVHPGVGNTTDTLVNALLYYTDKLSDIGGEFRPGIVHRLDKDTSGLLVVAKDNETHEFLSEQLLARTMKREYLALVDGVILEDQGQIDEPIGRDPNNRLKMCVIYENSKDALTNFYVLERFEDYTFIKAELYTGRMHQIRVHMKYIGYPVVGDMVYGRSSNEFRLNKQLLHSHKIGFIHPATREYMEFENHSSKDINRVLEILRKREAQNCLQR